MTYRDREAYLEHYLGKPYEAPKTPEKMTNAELQAEIGRLQQILIRRVCGDPVGGVGLTVSKEGFHVKQGLNP